MITMKHVAQISHEIKDGKSRDSIQLNLLNIEKMHLPESKLPIADMS